MTVKKRLIWWLYAIACFAILLFIAPALISAADTLAVLFGVLLLIALGVWSWELWVSHTVNKLKEYLK